MLETSLSWKRASLRKLAPDFAFFNPSAFKSLSALFLPASVSAFALSAAFFILAPLPDRLTSGSSAVNGGLGGVRLFVGSERLRFSLSASRSVASDT